MTTMKTALAALALLTIAAAAAAQETTVRQVPLGDAREVVMEINGGFGTMHLKRGSGSDLLALKEKKNAKDSDESETAIDYHVEDGIGYLTVDLGTQGADDMNALACLLKGSSSRTWYLAISDRVPVRLDVTLGAGKASIDLTDLHIREFNLDAGAGSVRLNEQTQS